MRDRGVRAIALYKTLKGAAQVALAAALVVIGTRTDEALARFLHTHASAAWSVRAAALVTPAHVHIATLALLFDGVLTSFEGWALRRGHTWGAWLVVLSTSTFLPFEILGVLHHPRWTRIAALAVNVVIVVYLALRVRREQATV